MTTVLLFHHAQGLTEGIRRFADTLRSAGHDVVLPDLFDGQTFPTLAEGVDHAREVGFATLLDRGVAVATELPEESVYAGFSMGVMPAQKLAQTRPGALGALLMEAFLPVTEFGAEWPAGVPVQIHGMAEDEWFAEDRPFAEQIAADVPEAELFLYPGQAHLFADSSLPGYDVAAAQLLTQRALAFLAGLAER